ncbi:unnamed protein product [Rhodiola kirilowii]
MSEGKGVQHGTRIRNVDDDEMEFEHYLKEPGNVRVSVDDFFHVDDAQDVDNVLFIGGCNSYTHQGGGVSEKVQVKLSDTHCDGGDNNNESLGPPTGDYHLDTEFVDKDSDCEDFPREGLSFEQSSLETHSSGYSGSENSATGGSDSSSTSDRKPRSRNGKYNYRTVCKLHGVSKNKCDCQDQLKEKTEQKSPILYTSQKRRKLQSRLALMCRSDTDDMNLTSFSNLHRTSEEASLISNPKKTKEFLLAGRTIEKLHDSEKDVPVKGSTESSTRTRSRKAPVRYIDEFSGSLSFSDEKHSISGMPRNGIQNVRTSGELDNRHKVFKAFKFSPDEGFCGRSLKKSSITIRNACAQSKEFSPVTTLDSDEETDSDEPEKASPARKGSKIYGDRRKHQMIWTLPEVEKLVEGISHFGVGRWTEIQRLFFPTSTYRTPIDLRDKWRNLLKASNAWIQNDQEAHEHDEETHKNGQRQLPKEILHRINELGQLHPYPIKRTAKHTPAPTAKRSSRK